MNKETYQTPESEVIKTSFEGQILTGSLGKDNQEVEWQ